MSNTKRYTFKEAKLKGASFCAYQERTQQEVRNKLYSWGLYGDEVEEIIAFLIIEGFINEERFAIAYAGGKFRMNHWGRSKIRMGLQTKGVSPRCIETGVKAIDEVEYLQKIDYLIQKKQKGLTGHEEIKVKYRLYNYLISKGFESDIIWERINLHFSS